MTGGKGSTAQTMSDLAKNGGFRSLFFEGLPTMTGIVTIVAQPFAQDSMKKMFALPDWLPAMIALAAAGLLAIYRIRIVRKSGLMECAVCCPILVFIIFSAYVSGNNVVYYAKEGVSQANIQNVSTSNLEKERLAKQKEEIAILQEKLENANEMIKSLSSVLNLSQKEPDQRERSKVSSVFKVPALLGVHTAYAQNPEPEPEESRNPRVPEPQRLLELQEELKKYEQKQQILDKKLEDIKQQQRSPDQRQEAPLIKSW